MRRKLPKGVRERDGSVRPGSAAPPVGADRSLLLSLESQLVDDLNHQVARQLPMLVASRLFALIGLGVLAIGSPAERLSAIGIAGFLALACDMAGWALLSRRMTKAGGEAPRAVRHWVAAISAASAILWAAHACFGGGGGLYGTAGSTALYLTPVVVATAVYAPVALAAIVAFAPPLVAIAMIGFSPGDAVAVILCGAAVAISIVQRHRAILQLTRRRALDARAATVASELLSEFEQSGRGWFWETDPEGRLTYITPQLAEKIGRDPTALIRTPFTDLIVNGGTGNDHAAQERTLGFHLSTKLMFSEVAVRAADTPEERWWSLSGRPAFDRFGNFLGFRGSGSDLTEMRRSEAEVKRLARYDALTGLPNRLLMRQTLEGAIRDVSGRLKHCALFLLDLDRFKNVNDTLGHPVGDLLLRQVAERLIVSIGDNGRVGRLGGDEFNVVLPGMHDRGRLAALADTVIVALSQPYMIEGAHVSIGTSLGIAIAPEDGATADSLVRNADLALYAAKADGKGVHRFYAPEMHASAKDRRLLEVDLRNVLADGGLHVVYQPVVDAASEVIVGFEALVRWNHPTRGAVSPAEFIPIAEEIGLIPQIGEWVLREACMEAARWPDPVRVAVNISPIQFANRALPGIVMGALAASGLPPERLELEITEGVFLNDGSETDEMFARLKAIGVRFALDDFGTGYSSLGYLKKAPFNKIKIDQSFVRGAAIDGSRNAAIIRAIVALAESLDMETTAEGAETLGELELIRSLGCSHVQGYIFGKPMLGEDARIRLDGGGHSAPTNVFACRTPRLAVLRSASFVLAGRMHRGRLRNLSERGAMVETEFPPHVGMAITINIADGPELSGAVRWVQDDRFGIAFERPISLDGLSPARMRPDRVTAQA